MARGRHGAVDLGEAHIFVAPSWRLTRSSAVSLRPASNYPFIQQKPARAEAAEACHTVAICLPLTATATN